MKSKITKIITATLLAFSLTATVTIPTFADSICDNTNIPEEVRAAQGCSGVGEVGDLSGSIQTIINGIILSLGIFAVIVVLIGGVSYMTSAGDSGKLKRAKDTILYACIGLIICVLAFAIVNFAIGIIEGTNSTPTEEETITETTTPAGRSGTSGNTTTRENCERSRGVYDSTTGKCLR